MGCFVGFGVWMGRVWNWVVCEGGCWRMGRRGSGGEFRVELV